MPIKRIVKIASLIALLLLIISAGVYMFQNLIQSRMAHNSNLMEYIPDAPRMIKVNTLQGLNNVASYNSFVEEVVDPLKRYINLPFYIADYDKNHLLIAKIIPGNEDIIKQILLNKVTHAPYPKVLNDGDITLLFYALPNNKFLVCSFYNGIMGICEDYKMLEMMLNGNRNNFFDDGKAENLLSKLKDSYPSHTFIKSASQTSVLGMNVYPDSIIFEGFMTAPDLNTISLPSKLPPIEAHSVEVVQVDTMRKRNDIKIKIRLNKKS